MPKVKIDTLADKSEIVHYDTPNIPLYITSDYLSNYPDQKAPCHWHDDIELILILDGEMNYYINGVTVLLQKNDAIMINTRAMHYGYSNHNSNCEFICILFHPKILASNKYLFEQTVESILTQANIPYLLMNNTNHPGSIQIIKKILNKKKEGQPFYELEVIGMLFSLWANICEITSSYVAPKAGSISTDTTSFRKMLSFIHSNFQESLTLDEIADSGNICKSKCCSVFKQEISQTPIDFLNTYRLQISAKLLTETSTSITTIASDCGFNNLSYFSKSFLRYYGCTPREYRQHHKT